MLRNSPFTGSLNVESARIANTGYRRGTTKPYAEATIDNMPIGGLFSNAPKNFMGSVGLGIIPLINQDGTLEDSLLNILVETSIDLECVSHGTNLLMKQHSRPQPNTNYAGLPVDRLKWTNKYTVTGAPAMET